MTPNILFVLYRILDCTNLETVLRNLDDDIYAHQ